jgi:hypothetical protein
MSPAHWKALGFGCALNLLYPHRTRRSSRAHLSKKPRYSPRPCVTIKKSSGLRNFALTPRSLTELLEPDGVWSSILPGIKMQLDQSTRRRFTELLGCAAGIALLAACMQKAVMQAVEFKGATAPNEAVTDSVSQQAKVLGAPMAAVERALQISRQPIFPKKDVLAVFDISQPSSKKRFYVLDFESGQVTAHYAAHGRDNGPQSKAIKFKGFQTDLDMVPLGPLKTAHSEVMDPYKTIVDRYDGTVYPNMIVVVLDGVTSYNSYISHTPPYKWIIHPNWYTTAAFRARNNGVLGRSTGCITLDPIENNELITRLQDGALVYVTVGDDPIEQYL